jgi:hypothetical protein
MMRRKFRPTLDGLETKMLFDATPLASVPPPVGITQPLTPAPSQTDLQQAQGAVYGIVNLPAGATPVIPSSGPIAAVPIANWMIGTYDTNYYSPNAVNYYS